MCEQLGQGMISLWGHPLSALFSLFKSTSIGQPPATVAVKDEMKYGVINKRKKQLTQ